MKRSELRKIIREMILKEYHGEDFMEQLIDVIYSMDQMRNKIKKKIYDNDFQKTSADRDFKNVEKYLDLALKYAKLGSKAIKDVTS